MPGGESCRAFALCVFCVIIIKDIECEMNRKGLEGIEYENNI